jgi:S1-C subfamily serine protease
VQILKERLKVLWLTSYCARLLLLGVAVSNVIGIIGGQSFGMNNIVNYFVLRGAQVPLTFARGSGLAKLQLLLFPLAQRDLFRGLLEIALAWFAAALLEQYVTRRQWLITVLASGPCLGLLTFALAHLAKIRGSVAGAGILGAVCLCVLASRLGNRTIFPDLSNLTFVQLRNIVVAAGVVLETVEGERLGAGAWLVSYPTAFLLSGRLPAFARALLAPAPPPVTEESSAHSGQVNEPSVGSPDGAGMLAPQVIAAPKPAELATPTVHDVVLVAFPPKHGEPAQLLQVHFGLAPEAAVQLLGALPWTIKRTLQLDAARALATRFEQIGAVVELNPRPERERHQLPPGQRVGEGATPSERVPCTWCGEGVVASAKICVHCSRSLLVDLVALPIADPRERYRRARAVSEQLLAGDFSRAREALESVHSPMFVAVSRDQAEMLIGQASSAGVTLESRPTKQSLTPPDDARKRQHQRRLQLTLAAAAICSGLIASVVWSRRNVAAATRSAADIAESALPGIATLSCSNKAGAGFFVEKRLIVTNNHVVCSADLITVRLASGRKLEGTVKVRDEELDLALVSVSEDGESLALGDASGVRLGDVVYLIGNPQGLSFSLATGHVSHPRRSFGPAVLLQLDAAINPGNSGGPVIDEHGRVLGVVTLKASKLDGVGFAVPINYAYQPGARLGLSAPAEANDDRWTEMRREGKSSAERELNELLDQPALLEAECRRTSNTVQCTSATLAIASEGPVTGQFTFRVEAEEKAVCTLTADVSQWDKHKVPAHLRTPKNPLLDDGLDDKIYIAKAEFGPLACDLERNQVAELVVEKGASGADRLELRRW